MSEVRSTVASQRETSVCVADVGAAGRDYSAILLNGDGGGKVIESVEVGTAPPCASTEWVNFMCEFHDPFSFVYSPVGVFETDESS